jgi:SAM-dependent methyltransferase
METITTAPAATAVRTPRREALTTARTPAHSPLESPLGAWTEPLLHEPFARNAYARMRDLDSPRLEHELREMEAFIAKFIVRTRPLFTDQLAYTGDRLDNWSRRWEFPYCWWNLRQGPMERVLDAGSGFSFFSYLLAGAGASVSAADIDPKLSAIYEKANEVTGRFVDYRVSPIEELVWPDQTFDAVACVSVLEHAPRRFDAIDEFARVLRPGGRLVITWDISLTRDSDVKWEDACILLDRLQDRFEPVHELDLHRPTDLLTTDRMLANEKWRLPWRPHKNVARRFASWLRNGSHFHSLAVLGTTWRKKGG